MSEAMTREKTLRTALDYVTNDRNVDNGDPEDNFSRIAELWSYWLREKYGIDFAITPTDVAMMSLMIKIARLLETEEKEDNWVDIAGYAACGSETASIEAGLGGPIQEKLPLVEEVSDGVLKGSLASDEAIDALKDALGDDLTAQILGEVQ